MGRRRPHRRRGILCYRVSPGLRTAVAALGQRLLLAVAERPILLPGGVAVPATISVGAPLVATGDGSPEHAIDFADRALYAAKRHGRNRLHRFSDLDNTELRAEQPDASTSPKHWR
jgi:GGDEF domain-containing protein